MATSSQPTETAYFPCPAGVNVADYVTLMLGPANYHAWKRLMVAFLTDQKLIGFVDGTISPMKEPPSPVLLREPWEEKRSIEEEITAELTRQTDWEDELQRDSQRMSGLFLNYIVDWKQEKKVVEKWEENRMEEWKKEQERREANWKKELEQLQESIQPKKLPEIMKLDQKSREKGKGVLDESQKEIRQDSDEAEEGRRQSSWESSQERHLTQEQERRRDCKSKLDDTWKLDSVKLKELVQKLDLEANARNEWHRKWENQQKENWERRKEWERGEKHQLLIREEDRKYTDWKRSDGRVTGWIQATVTQEILVQVIHLKTARKVWIKLEKIFIPPFSVPSRAELIDWTDQSTGENVRKYMELHRAALAADWKTAEKLLDKEPDAVLQPITWCKETVLIVAVRSDRKNNFVQKLLGRMASQREMKERSVWQEKWMKCMERMRERIQERMMLERMDHREMNDWMGTMAEKMDKMNLEIKEMIFRATQFPSWASVQEMMERHWPSWSCDETGLRRNKYQEMMMRVEQEWMVIMRDEFSGSVPLFGETDISGATALHAAVERGNIDAVNSLIFMNPQLVNIGDRYGTLALHVAARLGNREMVEFLRPLTTNLHENESCLKLMHFLASSGLYDIALTFLHENPRLASMKPSPLDVMAQSRTSFRSGTNLNFFQSLIYSVISLKAKDTANCPQEGKNKLGEISISPQGGEIGLVEISNRPQEGDQFELGESSNPPQVGVTVNHLQEGEIQRDVENPNQEGDIKNPAKCKCCKWSKCCKCADHLQERDMDIIPARCMCKCCEFVVSALRKVWQKLNAVLCAQIPALQIKYIKKTKLTNQQALEFVKCLCKNIVETDFNAAELFREPLMNATCAGIHEILAEILYWFPDAVRIRSKINHQSLFHLAIVSRQESIFNVIYQMKMDERCTYLSEIDASGNNGLHLAGKLTEAKELSLRASVAGAAQQMQREVQWFKEVEKYIVPEAKKRKNREGKTPREVFTDTHKELAKDGEEWMKDTANSCSIVAALITTIVFAAAITIPGNYNSNSGLPFFLGNRAFTSFNVSNAFAMLFSSSSLLAFLSVLTCRYAEEDFLHSLPRRMIIGQVTLFLSIACMMVAFAGTLKVVSGETKRRIIIPVGVLCCVPIIVFVFCQYKLFLAMIKSTYFPGIFKKQRNCHRVLI